MILRDAAEDKRCIEQLELLQKELRSVEVMTFEMKKQLAVRKEKLDRIRGLNEVLMEWKEKLTYMAENMPPLPKKNLVENVQTVPRTNTDVAVSAVSKSGLYSSDFTVNQGTGKQEAVKCTSKQETVNTYFPEIDWLTTDEFDKIPKYLKGRLSYDKVNKFIEGMNQAFSGKYKLLKLKKSSLNDAKRKKVDAYKMQETKDTKGSYFVVDDDLKEFGGLKIDNVARSVLTILRHCGRCREVRGGHLTRYCYIDSY